MGKANNTTAKYFSVMEDECNLAHTEFDEVNKAFVPVKVTMKVHHVHGNTKGIIRTRTTSCYCDAYTAGNHHHVSEGSLINGIP